MQREDTAWRALPPSLYAWFAVELVYTVFTTIVFREHWFGVRLILMWDGLGMASSLLAMFGALELASRASGTARVGLQLAAWANLAVVAIATLAAVYFELARDVSHWLIQLDTYIWFGLDLAIAIGWTLAALRHRAIAAAAITVVVLCGLPGHIYDTILGQHDYSWLRITFSMLRLLASGALVVAAAHGRVPADPSRAARGLQLVASSMMLRVITAVLGAFVLATAVMSTGPNDTGFFKLGLLIAAGLGVVAQAMLAYGLLDSARAAVRELPRWLLVPAGAGAAWTAGVTLRQLTALYTALYRDDRSEAMDTAQALPIATPLVGALVLILLAIAIGVFAHRRADGQLRGEVAGKSATAIVLWVASLAVTTWAVPDAKTATSAIMLMGFAAIALLVAMILLAGLCRRVAEALVGGPTLPDARVVR